jgi:hypothetical protein
MSRYQPLAEFLAAQKGDSWDASFAEVEACLGFALPQSAYKYPAWWANQTGAGHTQTRGWRSVGWRTSKVDLDQRRITFRRDLEPRGAPVLAAAELGDAEELLRQASELTGIGDRALLIREALRALVAREASARLARLGGSMPQLRVPERVRSAA